MRFLACRDCDLLVRFIPLNPGEKAYCPRCRHLLAADPVRGLERAAAFSLAGIIFMALANFFPFLVFEARGRAQVMTLIESVASLYRNNNEILAVTVLALIIVIPAVVSVSLSMVLFPLVFTGRTIPGARRLGRLIFILQSWCMPEVFLIGVLASLVKIASMASVITGISFWAYAGFSICFTLAFTCLNRHQFWNTLFPASFGLQKIVVPENAETARSAGLSNCSVCGFLSPADTPRCVRCGGGLHLRTANGLQKTVALLLTAGMLYFPANLLPITRTDQLGGEMESTILGGVIYLWEHHSYGVALIIFLASVLVPILKLFVLSWLSFSVAGKHDARLVERTRMYRIIEVIGRWSMMDVFVVTVLVALIQLGGILTIYPGAAALAFCFVVIITMLAAQTFDPRLMWDQIGPDRSGRNTTEGHLMACDRNRKTP